MILSRRATKDEAIEVTRVNWRNVVHVDELLRAASRPLGTTEREERHDP